MQPLSEMSTDALREYRSDKLEEKNQYDAKQQALKIVANSGYGSLGNQWFRWYSSTNATAITQSGQLSIKYIISHINTYLNNLLKTSDVNYVTYADTDSVYLDLTGLVNNVWPHKTKEEVIDLVDQACQSKIEKVIDDGYQALALSVRAHRQAMKMEREAIGEGVFVSKKRYVVKLYDNEGVRYADPELKIMGLEATRSDIPGWGRDRMKQLFKAMFDEEEHTLHQMIQRFWNEMLEAPLDDIATTTSVQNLAKYRTASGYAKGTPKHVKGSLMFNQLLNRYDLTHTYPAIADGDKVKMLPLKDPNPIQTNAICYNEHLPEEFGLSNYIDYRAQFEAIVQEPVERVLNTFGWSTEKKIDVLAELFG